jgi:hypothetical protein
VARTRSGDRQDGLFTADEEGERRSMSQELYGGIGLPSIPLEDKWELAADDRARS